MYRYKVKHNPFRRLKMAFKSRKRTRGNIFLGVVTTILASLSFTAMSACAKALAPISSEEMTFFRGLVGLIFIPLLTLQTKEPFFTGKYKFMLSLRGFFGSAALLFYFLSIEGMTLGDSQILSQLAAFFMCILSPIFLKENCLKKLFRDLLLSRSAPFVSCRYGILIRSMYMPFSVSGAAFFLRPHTSSFPCLPNGILNQIRKSFSISRFSVSP